MQAALPAEVPVDRPVVQHTPGPWSVASFRSADNSDDLIATVAVVGEFVVGPQFDHPHQTNYENHGSDASDAAVISDAPDMPASLLAYDRWADAVACRDPELEAIRRQMRAAIAKAKGG